MPEPSDKKLYEQVRKAVYKLYKKPSAYRSGALVKKYKLQFSKKYGARKKPYLSSKKPTRTGLARWYKEDWRNQRGQVGYSKRGDVYRPTKRITKKTPKTFSELSKSDVKKAMAEKKRSGRVKKF